MTEPPKPDPRFLPYCFACEERKKEDAGLESKTIGCFCHRATKPREPVEWPRQMHGQLAPFDSEPTK